MSTAPSIREGVDFPAPCPNCGEPSGRPFMAGTSCDDDRIRVGMRCSQCNFEWRFEMPTTRIKPDRRATPRFS